MITLNTDQRLFVIPCGSGFSCLGFDVCRNRAASYCQWLRDEGQPAPDLGAPIGTMESYTEYKAALEAVRLYCQESGKRCTAELTPELIGKEGARVEVETRHGDKRRFYVGKSTGFIPVHLEIARRDSSGGVAVTGAPFKSLRVVGRR